jgi:dTDP-4-amino-4,6-dideoxygalactose transaminase
MSGERAIPLFDLASQNAMLREEIDQALGRVVDSQHFLLGSETEAFEQEFASYCETRFAVGCSSGSDALLLALMAAEVGPGDQVLCPAYTFFATAGAISRLGATPVFVDIQPGSFNLCPEQARKAAARCSRLRALLPVHLFGQVADTAALLALAHELDVALIEDAAQSIGARDRQGRRAGSAGTVGCFSLYPTKNLGALGDAGALVTDDPEWLDRIQTLRIHGARDRYYHAEVGICARIDALQAAVLRAKLRHLDAWNRSRRRNAARYDEHFAAAGAAAGTPSAELESNPLPLATPQLEPSGGEHVYHHYVIRVPGRLRDGLRAFLSQRQIGTEIYYPLGLHQQECFRALGYREGDLPETEAAGRETLVLPVHPGLDDAQVDRVAGSVVDFLKLEP